MKVLVCDDLHDADQEFEDAIGRAEQPGIATVRLCDGGLKEQLSELINAADEVLTDRRRPSDLPKTEFDDTDLVVLDNNLAHLGIQGARLTAEAVAGYIRAFSSASYIVSINKNPDVDFDLRYLIGDYATRTDLALNLEHLTNPALWTRRLEDAKEGFLPWYWPKILKIHEDRRAKIEFVSERLEENVCQTFGFARRTFDFLPRQARAFLSQAEAATSEDFEAEERPGLGATFLGVFLGSSRSLPAKDEREAIVKKVDEPEIRAIISRVVAADLDYWFRRDVLGPQEVLIDIPHLLMRMPFLLGDNVSDLDSWNTAVASSTGGTCFGLDQALFEEHLKGAVFEQNLWAQYPCFWWPTLKDNDELNAHFSTDSTAWIDAAFCEDCSVFRPRFDENGNSQVSEFLSQFEGSWNRRYVANILGFKYAPRTRFAH